MRPRSLVTSVALIGSAAAAYTLRGRRWQLRWGATDQEVDEALPGDGLIARPDLAATRAITVRTSGDRVWPWSYDGGSLHVEGLAARRRSLSASRAAAYSAKESLNANTSSPAPNPSRVGADRDDGTCHPWPRDWFVRTTAPGICGRDQASPGISEVRCDDAPRHRDPRRPTRLNERMWRRQERRERKPIGDQRDQPRWSLHGDRR